MRRANLGAAAAGSQSLCVFVCVCVCVCRLSTFIEVYFCVIACDI
jgi:hypothetical protein